MASLFVGYKKTCRSLKYLDILKYLETKSNLGTFAQLCDVKRTDDDNKTQRHLYSQDVFRSDKNVSWKVAT